MDGWKLAMKDLLLKASSFVTIDENSFSKWNYDEVKDLNLNDCVKDLMTLIRILLTKFSEKKAQLDSEKKQNENLSGDNTLQKSFDDYERHYEKLQEFVQKLRNQSLNQTKILKNCVDSLVQLGTQNDKFLEDVVRKCKEMEMEKQKTKCKLENVEYLYISTMEKLSDVTEKLTRLRNKLSDFQETNVMNEDSFVFSQQNDDESVPVNVICGM